MGRTTMARTATVVAALTATALLGGCGSIPQPWASGAGAATAAGAGSSIAAPTSGASTPEPTVSAPPPSSASPTVTSTPSASGTVTAAPSPTPTPSPKPSPNPSPKPSPKPTAKPRTTLVRGDSGPKVLALQRRLTELGYWLGTPDGKFGSLTQQAVWAVQKAAGLTRDGVVGPRTLKALQAGIRPKATLGGNGVEIDLRRQLLLVVRGGAVRTILNTSTGSGKEYTSTSGNRAIATTPRGSYTVYRAVDGPVTNSLGQLWRPRFFNRGIAVHGSGNIPPWPDSHGCARLSNAAIDMIWAGTLMPIGSRVVVR